ncbi:nuclear transport factor NTF-2 [Metarhizium acridum CQMa 102]|uniref:NTF2-related export protein n=2 Tax=Metarhizium acridum TaxID=92637 RepID=E9EH61_METAQ|nr:nuclear transport factor NTF-2 [Metarhizium acridum CQMa 102]EFY84765.1 nuclear transport factor NTF-2 [Metarhizium acridum CQMa 102]
MHSTAHSSSISHTAPTAQITALSNNTPLQNCLQYSQIMADEWLTTDGSFIEYYYQVFDNDRPAVYKFYRDNSMMLWDTTPCHGATSITEKLTGFDAMPSNDEGGVMVLVKGVLLREETEPAIKFVQSFQLLPDGDSYFIFNDIFRMH